MGSVRRLAEFLLFISLLLPSFLLGEAQANAPKHSGKGAPTVETDVHHLQLDRVGGGKLSNGHPFDFRSYVRSDGTNGIIIMAHFSSPQDAQRQITDWLNRAQRVTKREHDIKKGQQSISDRIEGLMPDPKSGKLDFIIIRRDDLNCYLIQSLSSEVAMQVEDLIRPN